MQAIQKLWQVTESSPGEQKSGRRSARVLFITEHVRFLPDKKRNTGRDSSELPASICLARRFRRAWTGQQSYPGNSKRSTFSPPRMPDFGFFRWIRSEEEEEHLTSSHNRSEPGEKDFSAEARISPILTVPKNPVVAAAQMTCLSNAGHEVAAILLPRVMRRGRVITLLVFGCWMKLLSKCSAPLRRSLESLSSSR